jgi:hypothetical protein
VLHVVPALPDDVPLDQFLKTLFLYVYVGTYLHMKFQLIIHLLCHIGFDLNMYEVSYLCKKV